MIQKLQAMKAKKGFTLVELIVVIAIIAVLSAILIPTMMNWADNARIEGLNMSAKSFKNTLQAYGTQAMGKNGGFVHSGDNTWFTIRKASDTSLLYTTSAKAEGTAAPEDIIKEVTSAFQEEMLTSLGEFDGNPLIIGHVDNNGILDKVYYFPTPTTPLDGAITTGDDYDVIARLNVETNWKKNGSFIAVAAAEGVTEVLIEAGAAPAIMK